jgi:Uma2 family endonuclease
MHTLLERPGTTERFLAWEDQQEGKYEFDGLNIVPMTGGTIAHQDIMFNLRATLSRLLAGPGFRAVQEMRLRIGSKIRYPDVMICAGPLDQTTRTLTDALVIFEILSADTATTDRVTKMVDYAEVPSLTHYVLLEQTAIAATVFRRAPEGTWTASVHTSGDLVFPECGIAVPLADLYQGLTFPSPEAA